MGFFKRLLGICETKLPSDDGCWRYADGRLDIELSRAPELAAPGGALRFEGGALPKRVLLVHGHDGQFRAFPNRCTHAGHRRLDPVPGEPIVRCCSVGQSVFDYTGKRLSGSATESIQPLRVEATGDRLVIFVEEEGGTADARG